MSEHNIRYFGLNNVAIENDLRRVGREQNIQLQAVHDEHKRGDYYPQVAEKIRQDAATMARHYEIFYCLEISIRDLIRVRLEEQAGAEWWEKNVPPNVRDNANKNRNREIQNGVSMRSNDMLSYTTFGELGEIIKTNWNVFSDSLTDIKAVENVLSRLNGLRAPIAHCSMLAEDEVLRLRLSLRDWFRLQGE